MRILVHYLGMTYRAAWVRKEGKQGRETKSSVNSYFTKKSQITQQFAWQMLCLAVWNSNRLAKRSSDGITYSMGGRKRGSTQFPPDFYFPLPTFTQKALSILDFRVALSSPLVARQEFRAQKWWGKPEKLCASGWSTQLQDCCQREGSSIPKAGKSQTLVADRSGRWVIPTQSEHIRRFVFDMNPQVEEIGLYIQKFYQTRKSFFKY